MIGVGMLGIVGSSVGCVTILSGCPEGDEKGTRSGETKSGREKVGVEDVAGGGGRSQAASAMGTSGA